VRPAVPIRGLLAAKILQPWRPRPTPTGTRTDPLRNVLDGLPLRIRIHAAVCALCQGLLELGSRAG
jgi:hypothetical protein